MATYTPVPSTIPSSQRSNLITDVAEDDQIDLIDVLGRPARRLQFIMTDASDEIEYVLNSLKRLQSQRSGEEAASTADRAWGLGATTVNVWSTDPGCPEYSSTGSTVIETAEGLQISSVQINGLTLGTGTTISIVCW